jgi:hypothetical protein
MMCRESDRLIRVVEPQLSSISVNYINKLNHAMDVVNQQRELPEGTRSDDIDLCNLSTGVFKGRVWCVSPEIECSKVDRASEHWQVVMN